MTHPIWRLLWYTVRVIWLLAPSGLLGRLLDNREGRTQRFHRVGIVLVNAYTREGAYNSAALRWDLGVLWFAVVSLFPYGRKTHVENLLKEADRKALWNSATRRDT